MYLPLRVATVFSLWVSFSSALAQQTTSLTLNDAISIALDESYSMKSLRIGLRQAEHNLWAARGRFRTNAELGLQVPSFSEQVSESVESGALPVYDTRGTTRWQGNLDVNQPLPTDGQFRLRSTLYQRNTSTLQLAQGTTLKGNDFFTSVSLQFEQPLFTLNTLKMGLRKAELNWEQAEGRINKSEWNLVYQVTVAFYDLYSAQRAVQIASEEVKQQSDLMELAQKKYKAGLIPEVEALQTEVDFARSSNGLLQTKGDLRRSQDMFKQTLGLSLHEDVVATADTDFRPVSVDLEEFIQRALNERWDVRQAEIDEELARWNLKEADARSDLRADLLAYYDLTGVSDPSMPYGTAWRLLAESSLDDLRERPRNRGVVFTVSVPLWDWGVNANEVAAAQQSLSRARLDAAETKKTIEREVRSVVSRMEEALDRFEVLRRSAELAQRTYDISRARFDNGDITSQDLLLEQNRLTAAKTEHLRAFISYQVALADLKRKTFHDFSSEN